MVSLKTLKKNWDWASAGESFSHWQTKRAIAESLKAAGLDATVEHEISQGTGYCLRVDVAVPSLNLAIEVQRGNLGYAHLKERKLTQLGWQVSTILID